MSSTSNTNDIPPNSKELPPDTKNAVLFFWASWHEPTAPPNGSIHNLFHTLASSSSLSFYRIEAEVNPDLSMEYDVTVVPSFVLLDSYGKMIKRIEGVDNVSQLTQAVAALQTQSSNTSSAGNAASNTTAISKEEKEQEPSKEELLHQRLKHLIQSSQVMLFMKGSPTAPKCGFSRQAIELLTSNNISFGTFDILQDEDVRQGLKSYSDWPTFPQLYVKGELIGGLDIMKEMAEESQGDDGGFAAQLDVEPMEENVTSSTKEGEESPSSSLEDRLKKLVNRNKVMLFMKGVPSEPRCGFSRQICEILNGLPNVSYDAFDILEDEDVRQGLKKFSDWPTYPQLYVNGELLGGLDIVKEMKDEGDLIDLING